MLLNLDLVLNWDLYSKRMKKKIFLLIIIPFISLSQSGISISGLSQFNVGQSIFPSNEGFHPVSYEVRNNKITLSIFRGRKLKIGTIAVKGNVSYDINNTYYYAESNLNIPNYEVIKRSLIPSLELWYIVFQNEKVFIYTSLGSYGVIENLNIDQESNVDLEISVYEHNGIIPFIRTGVQLNYGRFFINPFISFDLQKIDFNKFNDIFEANLKEAIENYTIRTGLEFGIMF